MQIPDNYAPVSLIKRLLAIIYDLFLLIAVFFAVGIPLSILTTFIFNAGDAITEEHRFYLLNQIIILCGLFIASLVFYGWFWTHGGQTLGMKTWRIMLLSNNAQKISWKQAMQRYFAAILSWLVLGMGFLLSLVDDKKRCWHDMLSGTCLVQLEKTKK
ncbi:MAG TPA: RDD family protein [Gammaproteobacteria bacterium]